MLHRREFLHDVATGIGGAAVATSTPTDGPLECAENSEPVRPTLSRPVPYEVFQRDGFAPLHAHEHESGCDANGEHWFRCKAWEPAIVQSAFVRIKDLVLRAHNAFAIVEDVEVVDRRSIRELGGDPV